MYVPTVGAEIELVSELHFHAPPVSEVILSLFFEPVFELTPGVILPILNQWMDDYPLLDEGLPARPWSSLAERKMHEGTQNNTHWPVPLTSVASRDTTQIVRVQEDRFELVWQYDPEQKNEYPGFSNLREELLRRFTDFCNQVAEDTGAVIQVERADADYINLIQIPVNTFCAGVLTNWRAPETTAPFESAYTGLHLRDVHGASTTEASSVIRIHADVDEEATTLDIDVRVGISEEIEYGQALNLAHKVVLTSFKLLTSDQMRADWGAR